MALIAYANWHTLSQKRQMQHVYINHLIAAVLRRKCCYVRLRTLFIFFNECGDLFLPLQESTSE